ncbi:unnamed protein product, partial [Ectocarpus sp. 12 AP-2014]
MRKATDSHILALVDVESSTWVILGVVLFLNLARIKIWQMTGLTKEEEDHADDDHGTTDGHGSSSMSSHDDHAATASRVYDHGRRWLAGDMGEFASDAYGNTGPDGE